jgi:hypothetical protein
VGGSRDASIEGSDKAFGSLRNRRAGTREVGSNLVLVEHLLIDILFIYLFKMEFDRILRKAKMLCVE